MKQARSQRCSKKDVSENLLKFHRLTKEVVIHRRSVIRCSGKFEIFWKIYRKISLPEAATGDVL